MNNVIIDRLAALRREMKNHKIDLYIVPTSDYHDSEYVGEYFRCREYLSGFSGSAGTLIVTADEAGLWTDGRYFLQAEEQLRGTSIDLYKSGQPGVPTCAEFVDSHLRSDCVVGIDGRSFSVALGKVFSDTALKNGATLDYSHDLTDIIWTDRPALSCNEISILSTDYCGVSAADKLANVRAAMAKLNCDAHIITSLDDIAWLLNLRGSDVECNPVFLSNIVIYNESALLFANISAMSEEVKTYCEGLNIELKPYDEFYDYVASHFTGLCVLIDSNRLNYTLYMLLRDRCNLVEASNPTILMKAVKNDTEIKNLHKANITDGIAMVRFLMWLEKTIGQKSVTELSASAKLEEFRAQGKDFEGISFETIAGYNAHGAIIHYEPTEETDVEIKPEGLLLVDSGAQYLSGTTDITRTIAVGPVSEDMRKHYTMVLRGNLNLSAARFPKGCCGANLDILARAPFWNEGLDYNHGTGHGVGFYLNVHEGPASFHWNTKRLSSTVELMPGMLITDEPGIYLAGRYGIRIENDLLCVEDFTNEYGTFFSFEPLTLCPIDLTPVNVNELTAVEKETLNAYHSKVFEALSPYLDAKETEWLRNATRAI